MGSRSMRGPIGFLRTTALGGLLFLLPLVVVGALVAQVVPMAMSVAAVLGDWLPIRTPAGIALLVIVALAAIVGACFLAGLLARVSIGQRFGAWAERSLQMLFPRYAIIREQMAGNLGTDDHQPRLVPVLVDCPEGRRLGFETDRVGENVAVYMPGSPDVWGGYVVYAEAAQVRPVDLNLPAAIAICEGLGRESIDRVLDGDVPPMTGNAPVPAETRSSPAAG